MVSYIKLNAIVKFYFINENTLRSVGSTMGALVAALGLTNLVVGCPHHARRDSCAP